MFFFSEEILSKSAKQWLFSLKFLTAKSKSIKSFDHFFFFHWYNAIIKINFAEAFFSYEKHDLHNCKCWFKGQVTPTDQKFLVKILMAFFKLSEPKNNKKTNIVIYLQQKKEMAWSLQFHSILTKTCESFFLAAIFFFL